MGFHADQEAMRVLALSIDETRRGQTAMPRSAASAASTPTFRGTTPSKESKK
jgi:hypothetical protein